MLKRITSNELTIMRISLVTAILVAAIAVTGTRAACPPHNPCDSQLDVVRPTITSYDKVWFPQIVAMPDGGYVMAGSFATDGSSATMQVGTDATAVQLQSTRNLSSNLPQDIYVVRFNAQGSVMWVRQHRCSPNVLDAFCDLQLSELQVNPTDGSIFLMGTFRGIVHFGDNDHGDQTALNCEAWSDMFLCKMTAEGRVDFVVRSHTPDPRNQGYMTGGMAMDVSADGQVVVAGFFESSEPQFGSFWLKGSGAQDLFIVKYNAWGGAQWARMVAADERAWMWANNVSITPDGSRTYIAGTLSVRSAIDQGVLFGPGEANQTYLKPFNQGYRVQRARDAYVAAYDTLSGNLVWVRRHGGDGEDLGLAVQGLNDNSVVLAGYFQTCAQFDDSGATTLCAFGSKPDMYLARLSSSGALQWVRHAGGSSDTASIRPVRVKGTADGSQLLVAGYFKDSILFGPGEGYEVNLNAASSQAGFYCRYDAATGALQWAKQFGCSNANDYCTDMALDGQGGAWLTGLVGDNATFAECEDNETLLPTTSLFTLHLGRCDEVTPAPTNTPMETGTVRPTFTPSQTRTATNTRTPTQTFTPSQTRTMTNTPRWQTPATPTITPTRTPATRGTIVAASISDDPLLADGSTVYTVSLTATDPDGVADIKGMRVLFNYDMQNATSGRGYLCWGLTEAYIETFPDTVAIGSATGEGYWGWAPDNLGSEYITPLGCSSHTQGENRVVFWQFAVNPQWAVDGPLTGNFVLGFVRDLEDPPYSDGWTGTGVTFAVESDDPPCPAQDLVYGDVNADDYANNVDALIIHSYFLGLAACLPADTDCDGWGPEGAGVDCPAVMYGDVNDDISVNNTDALMLQAHFLGLLECFPIDTDCDGRGPE